MQKNIETAKKIPIFDLNFSAYQFLHKNIPELEIQGNRVIFLFNADEIFYKLSTQYHNNEKVSILDFVNASRQLRAKMYSMLGQR